MTLFSDEFGVICAVNLAALMACLISFRGICIIDLHQRMLDRDRKIYVGKWAFLFFTFSKDKDWYPKRTIVITLTTYIVTVITLIWCVASMFLPTDVCQLVALGLMVLNYLTYGIIGNMAQRYRGSH